MARILIIEDEPDLAEGLCDNLRLEGHEAEASHEGEAGLAALRRHGADLVILDVMLPDTDGYQVLRRMRSENFEQPVLMLTARGEEADKVRGFRLGADDYVTKPFGLLELLARVEALLRRAGLARNRENGFRLGSVEVDPGARAVRREGSAVELAPKEFDLLVALQQRGGEAVSRQELLREVWGHRGAVHTRTVDTHVAELRRKIEPEPDNPRFLQTVRKYGYRLVGDEPVSPKASSE